MKRLTSAVFTLILLTACSGPMNNTQKGAAIGTAGGAAAGALIGQIAGKDTKSTLIGAAIGAAIGGGTGAGVGYYMDKQETEMRQAMQAAKGVSVARDGEKLNVTFKSDNQFKVGSSVLLPAAQTDLDRFAEVVREYDKTRIVVVGHTDSTGSESVNQKLSEQRAGAVKNLLVARGIAPERITTVGLGAGKPMAENSSEAGRQLNRRVEISIVPQEGA